jgi:hypothetical protein
VVAVAAAVGAAGRGDGSSCGYGCCWGCNALVPATRPTHVCPAQTLRPAPQTQKFGHVTFFWNGNRSGYFDSSKETYLEIPSDNVGGALGAVGGEDLAGGRAWWGGGLAAGIVGGPFFLLFSPGLPAQGDEKRVKSVCCPGGTEVE